MTENQDHKRRPTSRAANMRALGTIIEWSSDPLSEYEFYTGILDYFDWWTEIDFRLAAYHDHLSPPAFALGHDIVNMAAYVNEILFWHDPKRIRQSPSLIIVSSMTEAFFFSIRAACDAIAAILAHKACDKPGQAPRNSLRALLDWSQRNPQRVRPEIKTVLSTDLSWFWRLRQIRDEIGHGLADCGTFRHGGQFDMMMMSTKKKQKATRVPLFPLLAEQLAGLTALSDQTAIAVNKLINLPPDRIRSRVVQGALIPALPRLIEIAGEYAEQDG
jgi:hypothetical protein